GKPTGPIRNRGKQKTADDGRDVAKQHFVDMPIAWRKGSRKPKITVKHGQPQRNHRTRIDRTEQEEGAETVGKDHRALIVSQVRVRHEILLSLIDRQSS